MAEDEISCCEDPERRPARVWYGLHDAFDRHAECLASDLRLALRLVVRNLRVHQAIEVDGS